MESVKYPCRCLNHVFGYCAENKKGRAVVLADKSEVTAFDDSCKKNWEGCKSYVTNIVANPHCIGLEKKAGKNDKKSANNE